MVLWLSRHITTKAYKNCCILIFKKLLISQCMIMGRVKLISIPCFIKCTTVWFQVFDHVLMDSYVSPMGRVYSKKEKTSVVLVFCRCFV